MQSRVVMILHDAIWVEAPQGQAGEAQRLLGEAMKHSVEMPSVPLEVEFE
jgi:DNA polymerase I-like protein with 3'-5' exonuclease and polymerase domains